MMERTHIILLILLGAAVGIFGIVTFQWYMILVILVLVVLVLLARDFKRWVESLVETIAAARDPARGEGNRESIASMKADLAGIERRLEALEQKRT